MLQNALGDWTVQCNRSVRIGVASQPYNGAVLNTRAAVSTEMRAGIALRIGSRIKATAITAAKHQVGVTP